MPKYSGRKQRAKILLERLTKGPSFVDIGPAKFTIEEATLQYRIWSESWILDELKKLIPELKPPKLP